MSVLREQAQFRDALVRRLAEDLVGPGAPDEALPSRPSDVYLTGILYPMESPIAPEEDESLDRGGGEGSMRGAAAEVDDQVPLVATSKPSSAGLSFSVETDGRSPTIEVRIGCGTYTPVLKEDGKVAHWKRSEHDETLSLTLQGPVDQGLGAVPGGRVFVQVSPWGRNRHTITVAVVNSNSRGASRNESEARTFFQVQMSARTLEGSRLVPRPSRRIAQDEDERSGALIYRHAAELATGHTCAADWELGPGGHAESVRMAWLPRATVAATSPNGDRVFERLVDGHDRLSATWLANAAPALLVEGVRRLVACYREWIDARRAEAPTLPVEHRDQAERHISRCVLAASRMGAACDLLESNALVREAFQNAQHAMVLQRQWASPKDRDLRWRPFQLAFQLLVLPSVADGEHPDRKVMDLLWFPTGGGKTEAYLALTAFVLFYRRLRGAAPDEGKGIAVLMRYTLRLLTVQQFQRAATMICACELLRRRAGDRYGETPFSIGLWVGNNATPGTVKEARENDGSGSNHRQLPSCPCCKRELEWVPNVAADRCQPKCVGKTSCALRESGPHLPVWTVDSDIYREVPSLLLATVDKFAQIVRNKDTSSFFAIGKPWAPIDLIIQDELHLISGPLGSMTGLYETAIDALISHRGTYPKIIGSTATIRRAEEQVRALFDRGAFQFPPPGLEAKDSGFAVRAEWLPSSPESDGPRKDSLPGRDYIGITTAGRSAKYVVQAVAAALLQAAHGLPTVRDEVRDPYWTLVSYFNTLRELGGSIVLMQDDVPFTIEQYASRRGEPVRKLKAPAELTSRVSSREIVEMLELLSLGYGNVDAQDTLLASNMISVGVDIPRLGLMIVVGQPKTVAEYIQATSRVGRSAPGLVVAIYNAGRARDRARFETFKTWHDTLYREVEATSVTPFAPRAQDKALHAALVALVRHLAPGMRDRPVLGDAARAAVPRLVEKILARVAATEPSELDGARQKLEHLVDQWTDREGLQEYWDDFGDKRTLLLSAEQWAASHAAGGDVSRALWATPNSMREVEPATPFVLVTKLSQGTGNAAE
jgi:hypothetical protein